MPESPPDLVAVMRFDAEAGIIDLDRHVDRLGAAMQAVGGHIDRHAVRNELHAATFRRMVASRVVLRLSPAGAIAIEVGDWRGDDALPEQSGTL